MVVTALSEPGSIPGRMWGVRNSWRLATTGVLNEIKILTNGNLVCSRVWNIKVISDLAQLEACSAHNRKDPGSKPGVAIEEKLYLVSNSKLSCI